MCGKIFRLSRPAVRGEITWRADDAKLRLRQSPRDQCRILQLAKPDADIDALLK
jgi:hypothetical protein